MNKPLLHVLLSLLMCLTLLLTVTAQVVDIPDPNLRTKIEETLDKAAGATITASDMERLIHLEARNANISDLTGLEHAINLTELYLGDKYVEGQGHINNNSVKDLSPLAELTKLMRLVLNQNDITDISAVAGLINLTWLDIGGNNLSDISPVTGLINLTGLRLWRNNIRDISAVAGLIHLTELNFHNNNISDISPLVDNTGLGSGDTVEVRGNPLSSVSIKTHIPALQSRGVTVEFDDRLPIPIPSDIPFADVPFDVTNIPEPVPPPKEVRDFFQLDPYYQQWINVRGFPVLASAEVSPYTVKEAAWQIWQMIGHRPDILQVMAQNKARFSIVPHNKHVSEIPEYDFGRLDFFWEMRARGLGGWTTTSPEENIICGATNYCYAEVIHEFAHQLHEWGLNRIDSTFDSRLETMYNAALKEGLYQNRYAGSNRHEYWAEGVGSWFNGPHRGSNVAHTRLALKKYDPRLATLLTEVFGDGSWRYTPPATRTHLPHLQGFNPQEAPIYQRPARLLELEAQLRDPNSDGDGRWRNLKLYDPSALSHLKKLTTSGNRTDFLFGKLIGTDLALYSFNVDGKKILYQYITSADFWHVHTEVGAIWLIQDHTGKDLAVFRAEKEVGRVLITPTLHLIKPGLSKVSGDNQTGVSGALLSNPFVVELNDETLSVLKGISVTFTITTGDGTLNVTHAITDENGRAESTLTLGSNQGTNTVSVSANGIEGAVTFNAVAEPAIDLPDPNLRTVIEAALHKSLEATITASEMATLTRLEARNANISDLTGLEDATNLTWVHLGDTHVEGQGWINSNSIKDLSPLAELSNLTSLNLSQNNISDLSPLAELNNLTWLDVGGNNLSNISPVAGLINLTSLRLWRNNIEDISAVAGLIHLTELNLHYNNISDLSPLVANTGLGAGDEVRVRENPLSDASIQTYIPALQSRGVTVEFDNRAPRSVINANGMVRVVYFLPNDRPARPDRVAALRQLIKDAQRFYADEMQRHGFGRKTFTVETDGNGEPLVHQIDGKLNENHYYQPSSLWKVWAELLEHFAGDDFQHAYFIAIDLSSEELDGGTAGGLASLVFQPPSGGFNLRGPEIITEREEVFGGLALIPSFGHNFEKLGLTAHEIGHTFGLVHDFRNGRNSDYVLAGARQNRLSQCAAEWLSVSRFFNTKSIFRNEPGEIQLLSLRALSRDAISFRFKVADPDGLHQAQLLVPEIWEGSVETAFQLFDCKRLNGKTGTVETVVSRAELVDRIALQIIDVEGNITWATLLIDLDTLASATNGDINGDGDVNVLDLVVIASSLGGTGENIAADVNRDGVVNILDLILGASMFESAAAAPSAQPQVPETLTAVEVQGWLTEARALEVKDPIMKRGFIVLEQLLVSLTPKETELLANYPNPFNPETWIPYRLAEDAFVTLTIYDQGGQIVRTLEVGHRVASAYENRSKAIYWEGRNNIGEPVASGVYFYTLTAGEYSATRRMVILK